MSIAMRNALFGKRLPYDHVVEFLESTGTQWIDTGMCPSQDFVQEITLKCTTPQNRDLIPLGVRISRDYFGIAYDFSTWTNTDPVKGAACHRPYASGWGKTEDSKWVFHDVQSAFITIKTSSVDMKVNGDTVFTWTRLPTEEFICPYSMGLFALFNYKYSNGSYARAVDDRTFIGQISGCKLFNHGVLFRDFIPVRFKNESGVREGAMFDRANPTVGMDPDGSARDDGIYRNRGTGAFLYGSDVVGGGYKRKCVRRSYRRSARPSARFWQPRLWKEVA